MKNKRNSTVDLLKGILVVFIIITHFYGINSYDRSLYGFPFWIDMAVPGFMMLSGYISAMVYEYKSIDKLSLAYSRNEIVRKLIRYSLPWFIAWLIELTIGMFYDWKEVHSLKLLLYWFVGGGAGQGGYYIPCLFQSIFLMPLLYFCIKKYQTKGLIGCFATNFLYEFLRGAYGMNVDFYRVIVLRYIFIIACGVYAYFIPFKWNKKLLMLCFVGGIFIILFNYCNFHTDILLFDEYKGTSYLTCLFIFPIINYLVKLKLKVKMFGIIGKASYHIFLVQKIFYLGSNTIHNIFSKISFGNIYLEMIYCMIIIVATGLIFFSGEQFIEGRLLKRLKCNSQTRSYFCE